MVLGEKDEFNRIYHKVELGIKCSPEQRRQAQKSHLSDEGGAFTLPVEVVILLGSLDPLKHRSLPALKSQVMRCLSVHAESHASRSQLRETLATRSKQLISAFAESESHKAASRFYVEAVHQADQILGTLCESNRQ